MPMYEQTKGLYIRNLKTASSTGMKTTFFTVLKSRSDSPPDGGEDLKKKKKKKKKHRDYKKWSLTVVLARLDAA